MGLKLVCPACGSIKVERTIGGKITACLEPDCLHTSRTENFRQRPSAGRKPNEHWRDPVALTMDGYDD